MPVWWPVTWPSLRRRRGAVVPEPAAAADTGALHSQLLEEIGQGRERILHRVAEVRAMTEREILDCGTVFASIVENVRHLIDDNARRLAASSASSEQLTSSFIAEMQENLRAQEAAVQQVLKLADRIDAAMDAINGLSRYSNILSINARIEAARLGERGVGFAVIADHVRDLSKTIQTTAAKVSESVVAVRERLPAVGESAAAMRERTESFIVAVAQQVQAGSLPGAQGPDGGSLDTVMELSNRGLSHLQFQDPMMQKLSTIDRTMDDIVIGVRRVLDGEEAPAPAAGEEERSAAQQPSAGTIMLFQPGEEIEAPSRPQ